MTADPTEIRFRPLRSYGECRACVEIQRETWGEESRDRVPASLLSVAVKVGGVAAGAFLPDPQRRASPGGAGAARRLVGFVFSLAGWRRGERVQWSHMLAVRRAHRDRGIGRRLKGLQRELALADGAETIYWTYDPLVARNAHLNLNLLGAVVDEFVPDMYGTGDGSPLFVGGATDRFVVRWELTSDRVERALADGDAGAAPARRGRPRGTEDGPPVVDPRRLGADQDASSLPSSDSLLLALPADAVSMAAGDPEGARTWRLGLRTALRRYLERGYEIGGFLPPGDGERAFYVLERA